MRLLCFLLICLKILIMHCITGLMEYIIFAIYLDIMYSDVSKKPKTSYNLGCKVVLRYLFMLLFALELTCLCTPILFHIFY
jgi:hypothetical protein